MHSFVWRMNTSQCRTSREHIQMRILFEEQTTFQTCMDSLYLRFNTEQLLITFHSHLQDRRRRIRFPTWIAITGLHFCTTQLESRTYHFRHILTRGKDRTSLTGYNLDLTVYHLDRSQIRRSFHQTRHILTPCKNPMMYSINRLQQTGNSISIDSLGTWRF